MLNARAAMLFLAGGLEKAAEHFRESLALVPDKAEIHNVLGLLLLQMDDLDAAEAEFKETERLDTKHTAMHYMGLLGVLTRKGDLEGAITLMEKAVAAFPLFAEAHRNLGGLRVCRREYAAALPSLREAVRLAPTQLSLPTLAYAQGLAGDLEGALETWKRLAQMQPGSAIPAFEIARTLRALGRFEEAETVCRDTIAVTRGKVSQAPEQASSYHNLAYALLHVPDPALRDYPGALGAARKAVELAPEESHSFFLTMLGKAQYRAGDFPAAVETLQRVESLLRKAAPHIETSSSCTYLYEPWIYQAMALWQTGRREEALDLFAKTAVSLKKMFGSSEPPGISFTFDPFIEEAATLLGQKK
jgi:tetratricopeptide (TPR) repeat protein